MSTLELREKVFKKLETVEDHVLEEILGIIELENTKDLVLMIPDEHKNDINIGLRQIDAGQTLTNDEVNSKVQQWLGK